MNPTLDLRDPHVSYAYTTAVRLLSLDRVTPFWPDLGLRIDDVEEVKTAARRFVRAEIAIEALDDDERDYDGMIAVHIAAFLADMERSQGTTAAAQVRAWIEERFFVLGQEPDWRMMWHVLVAWLPYRKEHRVASFGLPLGKIAKLVEIARAWADAADALDRRIGEAEALPLEGWDAEAYAAYRGDDPDLSPLTGLSLHLAAVVFERTWGAIQRLLGPAEMDALERWGQAEVLAHMDSISHHSARIPPEGRCLS
ncbi:hypothetical protein BE20_44830 [Sorangium cellulosum]|uniref:Uncharacterized protein n=1 Tax=Sorangium cellulosum TaxID=56 RepID=A0A150STA5_SORCE|nr:hypothetical protein BE18_06600 [Sorangium cellulosum]KYF95629.1 hypothetical protein BE20_44830 [Sorangium cellulosum]